MDQRMTKGQQYTRYTITETGKDAIVALAVQEVDGHFTVRLSVDGKLMSLDSAFEKGLIDKGFRTLPL